MPRVVGAMTHLVARRVRRRPHQYVLGQIDHHRARPPAARDVERLVHHARQDVAGFDQVVVLGARPGDPDRVGLLERVVADHVGRHLAGQADHRHAVHQGIGQAGDRVGRSRSRGHQDHAHLAGAPGVAFGRVHRPLLVADQDVTDRVLLEDRIVERQNRAPRIAEYHLDALLDQRPEHDLRAGHRACLGVRTGDGGGFRHHKAPDRCLGSNGGSIPRSRRFFKQIGNYASNADRSTRPGAR